jgi:hypothetical protein
MNRVEFKNYFLVVKRAHPAYGLTLLDASSTGNIIIKKKRKTSENSRARVVKKSTQKYLIHDLNDEWNVHGTRFLPGPVAESLTKFSVHICHTYCRLLLRLI